MNAIEVKAKLQNECGMTMEDADMCIAARQKHISKMKAYKYLIELK